MSFSLAAAKVRGFLFARSTGAAAQGCVAVLEAELDNGLWRPVGALAADHAGYVSFSLDPLCAEGRTQVLNLRVHAANTAVEVPAHASLAAHAPAFVLLVDSSDDTSSPSLPAIQSPDDIDREISPGSFAAAPTLLVGEGDCGNLIPGGLAGFDYGVYRVLRLARPSGVRTIDTHGNTETGFQSGSRSPTSGQETEVLSKIKALIEAGSTVGPVDVAMPLQELMANTTHVQAGLVLRFIQRWQPIGQCLGDISYSLALAPGEARDLAMIDWSRSESVSRVDDIDSSEQLLHNQHRDRSIEEALNAGLHEHQEGWSFMAGTAGAASASIPIETVKLSISGDHAIGVGISSTTGDRNLSGFSQQDLADTVTQATTVLRGLRSTVIVQADQNESNTIQTRTIANHNRCHALTVQYYEVLRTYRVTTQLAGADLALLVPHAVVTFDATAALHWRVALERNLLDPALAECFDALAHLQRCADTAYDAEPSSSSSSSPPPPPPAPTYVATSYTVRLDTGVRETWGSIWVNLISSDGTRSCVFFKPNVANYTLDDPDPAERHLVLTKNSVRTWTVSKNDDQINGIGLDLRTVETIEVEWVETNGEDGWAFSGISVTATADGKSMPILINGVKYFSTRPYIRKFEPQGHQHGFWGPAPAKIESTTTSPATPQSPPPPSPTHVATRSLSADKCCAEMLLGHLNDNAAYYSRVVWIGMDTTERRIRLLSALGTELADAIDDRPLAVGGNQVAFQLNAIERDDPRLAQLTGAPKPIVRYATVPARGVFAEAELGRCNACERRDTTRMTEWSPIKSPQIAEISPGPRGTTPQVQPEPLPGPVVQVVQAPNAPDPAGLGAAFTLLGQPNIFRDMSGRTELEHLLDGLVSGAVSLTEAQILAQQVKGKQTAATTGAGDAPVGATRSAPNEPSASGQIDKLDAINYAADKGLINDKQKNDAAVGVIGGESPSGNITLASTGVPSIPIPPGNEQYPNIEIRLRTFIPSPAVAIPLSAFLPIYNGNDKDFSYKTTPHDHKTFINLLINLDPSRSSPLVAPAEYDFGPTQEFAESQGEPVAGKPSWWWKIKPGETTTKVKTVVRTPANLNADVTRISTTRIMVRLLIDAPLAATSQLVEATAAAINAEIMIELEQLPGTVPVYRVGGAHDGFPAYELYINREAAYTHDPVATEKSPLNLFPPMEMSIGLYGSVYGAQWKPVQLSLLA